MSRRRSSETMTDSRVRTKHLSAKKYTLGILSDRETDDVPGTIRLFEQESDNDATDFTAAVSAPKQEDHRILIVAAKKTSDGRIVLNPQPEDSPNDPLNWPSWRRDVALLSLGFYCLLGGGMTPILAAGFNDVAQTYNATYAQVALTTGLYMMGMGVGGVIVSPCAILYGKRTVYLVSSILFIASSVWCALAPSYSQLVTARVFQGLSVSPVECLPSATIAEIFFSHERAFRIGIYTLLLLGGKNLTPLVSAVIIQAKGWRWVFWVISMLVALGAALLFFFVPETFWDRTPRPRRVARAKSLPRMSTSTRAATTERRDNLGRLEKNAARSDDSIDPLADSNLSLPLGDDNKAAETPRIPTDHNMVPASGETPASCTDVGQTILIPVSISGDMQQQVAASAQAIPDSTSGQRSVYFGRRKSSAAAAKSSATTEYTVYRRTAPALSFLETLRPWNGRLSSENWFLVAGRPFVLFAYPSVLWSSVVYACSVGWLIVLSESVARIYETRDSYNFNSLQVGLVYISPFVGGVLGTAVAGRVSDMIVQFMARRNGGIYEPEFRLVMGIPIAVSTAIGLMGFGWSAAEKDHFMVPTVLFGVISFGCCMGSTTAITFVVDSYRQYAAEALVTLNFSKNILHGLVWSLFFPRWLEHSGSKAVFLVIGGVQLACLSLSIPMYVYGKRARMWTVRADLMAQLERSRQVGGDVKH